jgi:hypothetical protein
MEAARLAGDTPSRPASAPPTDQAVQDCLTGTAQKEETGAADTSERHSNPETSPRQADTELEAESQPLLDPEEVTDRIEEVEIEDIGSHTVSDRTRWHGMTTRTSAVDRLRNRSRHPIQSQLRDKNPRSRVRQRERQKSARC